MKSKEKSSRSGFTLIELIMTIVIIGIVALPLSLLLVRHIESTFRSSDSVMALNLARFEMERVSLMSYSNVVTAALPNYQGYNYNVARTVTEVITSPPFGPARKTIRVDVRKTGSSAVLVSLVTYRAKNNVGYGLP